MSGGHTLRVAAIVTAAGSSARMGGSVSRPCVKKEYRALPGCAGGDGKPLTVLGAAVSAFAEVPAVSKIIVTVPPDRDNAEDEARAALPAGMSGFFFVRGGENRRSSVYRALHYLQSLQTGGERFDLVLIHDGARPWVSVSLIDAVIGAARVHGAAIPILPSVETPKILESAEIRHSAVSGFIAQHPHRETVAFAQTPQGFLFEPLMEAHEKAAEAANTAKNGAEFTDDAEVWAFAWPEKKVAAVPGEAANKKITFPEDLPSGGARLPRIGLGLDLHRLAEGRRFVLGGVEIPFEKGELGHSDGDVLIHAVIDALLGASGSGDIGALFPSACDTWKNAPSLELLRMVWARLSGESWAIVNIDCVVSCEKPALLPHREKIRETLGRVLKTDPGRIFLKGKTGEGIGEIGRGEAVEAVAVCLLEKR